MTPDESAWVAFAAAGMSASPEVRFTSVANDADEMLRLLRARRESGMFGATQENPPEGFVPLSEALREDVRRLNEENEDLQDRLLKATAAGRRP